MEWSDSLFDDEEIVKKIQRAYKRVSGGLNGNSLMMYSGTRDYTKESCSTDYFLRKPMYSSNFRRGFNAYNRNNGCLYLGDANLNEPNIYNEITAKLSHYTRNIGLIQIPHHGSIENFNPDILQMNPENRRYIVSFGTNNQWGHPADHVVSTILCADKGLAPVNEDKHSIYIQKTVFGF